MWNRRRSRPGSYFGEIALLDDGPRSATVTTEGNLTAYMLSPREFRPLVQANGNLAWGLLQGLWKSWAKKTTDPRSRASMGRAGLEPATLGLKVPCSTS